MKAAAQEEQYYVAHAAQLMREAVKRELESELRGLIMAARMHGFLLSITGQEMAYHATDLSALRNCAITIPRESAE